MSQPDTLRELSESNRSAGARRAVLGQILRHTAYWANGNAGYAPYVYTPGLTAFGVWNRLRKSEYALSRQDTRQALGALASTGTVETHRLRLVPFVQIYSVPLESLVYTGVGLDPYQAELKQELLSATDLPLDGGGPYELP